MQPQRSVAEVVPMGVRTQGQMGSADPPGKMDKKLKLKLKRENMQKRTVF